MKFSPEQKKEIEGVFSFLGIKDQKAIDRAMKGEWTPPIEGFPVNEQKNKWVTASIRFEVNENSKNSPLSIKIGAQREIPNRALEFDQNKVPALHEVKPGNLRLFHPETGSSFDATLRQSASGKSSLQVTSAFGATMAFDTFSKELIAGKFQVVDPEQQLKSDLLKPVEAGKKATKSRPQKQAQGRAHMDPMIQIDMLLKNMNMIKGNVQNITSDKMRDMVSQLVARKDFDLSDKDKALLNNMIKNFQFAEGKKDIERNPTKLNVTLSQDEKVNLLSYLGVNEPDFSMPKNPPIDKQDIDATIISYKEMMDKNVAMPPNFPPKDVLHQITATLATKSTFTIDSKLNPLSHDKAKQDLASVQSATMAMSMQRTKSKNINL